MDYEDQARSYETSDGSVIILGMQSLLDLTSWERSENPFLFETRTTDV